MLDESNMEKYHVVQQVADLMTMRSLPYAIQNLENEGRTMSNLNKVSHSDREGVADCLGRAIRHAERVCKREHIKGDRIERVNQFINSLRTQFLTYGQRGVSLPREMVSLFCHKEVWHDIGVPTTTYNPSATRCATEEILGILAITKRLSHHTDAQAEMILGDLEEIERGIQGLRTQVAEAERINNEGDKLVEELCAVFSDD